MACISVRFLRTSLPRTFSAISYHVCALLLASISFSDRPADLFHCTRNFIKDTHANGQALWKAIELDVQFISSHLNGWEGAQQMRIRHRGRGQSACMRLERSRCRRTLGV